MKLQTTSLKIEMVRCFAACGLALVSGPTGGWIDRALSVRFRVEGDFSCGGRMEDLWRD